MHCIFQQLLFSHSRFRKSLCISIFHLKKLSMSDKSLVLYVGRVFVIQSCQYLLLWCCLYTQDSYIINWSLHVASMFIRSSAKVSVFTFSNGNDIILCMQQLNLFWKLLEGFCFDCQYFLQNPKTRFWEFIFLAMVGDALSKGQLQNYPINHPGRLGTLPGQKYTNGSSTQTL